MLLSVFIEGKFPGYSHYNEMAAKSVSRERLEQILPAGYNRYEQLVVALDLMVHNRIETISQLNSVADELDKRHRSGNIVKVVGAATGAAGSVAGAAGAAAAPFTFGIGLVFLAGGAIVAGAGSLTVAAAHLAEKVCEKVDLEKVQQAVERDKAQCERVLELWKEFESYCVDTINTIALADPSTESDMASIQTWTQVAMEVVTSPVVLIAEAFDSIFSKAKEAGIPVDLCGALSDVARMFARERNAVYRSVVSWMKRNVVPVVGTAAFLAIAAIGVANLFVLFITIIDMNKGSPSKVAKDLREKSSELQKELNKWLDAFGKPKNT